MIVGPGGTGCDEVRFPVHSGWDSRDASVAGMLCQIVYNFCISHIVRWCLVWDFLVEYVKV